MSATSVSKDAENKTLIIERIISAPRPRVWQAWTTPEMFVKWWGPRGWNTTIKHINFTPGGTLLYGMKCVDKAQSDFFGQESWVKSVYQAINEPGRFTYKDYFCDA